MVKQCNVRSNLPTSIKIRVDNDLKYYSLYIVASFRLTLLCSKTVELAKRAEKTGVSWITVHGRTPKQRSSTPVDIASIKLVCDAISLPSRLLIFALLGKRKCFHSSYCEWGYFFIGSS